MALVKKTQFKGFDAEYFNIINLSWNKFAKQTVISIALYKDKATRDLDGYSFVREFSVTFAGRLSVEECYAKLKEKKTPEVDLTQASDLI